MSLEWIDDELRELERVDLLRRRVCRSGKLGAKLVIDGQRYLNFGSNDYLGIAADPALQDVVEKTVSRGGWGSGASPLIVGRSALHAELERRLAAFMDCEAALLFPTGFAANTGTIPALVGKQDVIFSDAKNHASIIDGCRLSGAQVVVFPHADVERLRMMIEQARDARRKLIVTDGLFSMDGDLARLPELGELAKRHGAMLMVDEAHALGVRGPAGKGVAAEFNVQVDVRVGTLSKALGSHGGFVAGSKSLIEYLSNRARSYVYSTAGPVAAAAVALAALNILRDEPERRERLAGASQHVRQSLAAQGWNIGATQSHIVPIIVGDPARAVELSAQLKAQKLWVPCIRPPSVPEGESLLRISLSSAHSEAMVDVLLDALHAHGPDPR